MTRCLLSQTHADDLLPETDTPAGSGSVPALRQRAAQEQRLQRRPSGVSLEEQKILLSLDRLNQRLLCKHSNPDVVSRPDGQDCSGSLAFTVARVCCCCFAGVNLGRDGGTRGPSFTDRRSVSTTYRRIHHVPLLALLSYSLVSLCFFFPSQNGSEVARSTWYQREVSPRPTESTVRFLLLLLRHSARSRTVPPGIV